MARFILAQLVLHVLKKDRWMREWYRRVKNRRGSKIARVAVMRRLTVMIWNMLRHQQPYRCGGPEVARRPQTPVTATAEVAHHQSPGPDHFAHMFRECRVLPP